MGNGRIVAASFLARGTSGEWCCFSNIWVVHNPCYDRGRALRCSLGGLLFKGLEPWVDQTISNKVKFLDVSAKGVAALVIEWNTSTKTISLIKVVVSLVEVTVSLIQVVATLVEVVATLVEAADSLGEVVTTLVCTKDVLQKIVSCFQILSWSIRSASGARAGTEIELSGSCGHKHEGPKETHSRETLSIFVPIRTSNVVLTPRCRLNSPC